MKKHFKKNHTVIFLFFALIFGLLLGNFQITSLPMAWALAKADNESAQMYIANYYEDKFTYETKQISSTNLTAKAALYKERAIFWYKQAAKHGNIGALLMYGLLAEDKSALERLAFKGNQQAITSLVLIDGLSNKTTDVQEAYAWNIISQKINHPNLKNASAEENPFAYKLDKQQIIGAKKIAERYLQKIKVEII